MESHPLGWRGSSWQRPDARLPLEPTDQSSSPQQMCPARKEGTPLAALAARALGACADGPAVRKCFWTGVRLVQEDLGSLDAEASVPCAFSPILDVLQSTCMPCVLRPSYRVTEPALVPQRPQCLPQCH